MRYFLLFLLIMAGLGCGGRARDGAALPQRRIIDMHVHAFGWNEYGDPPPPNEITGVSPSARTDEQLLNETLAELRRLGIVKAVVSGPLHRVAQWKAAAPEVVIGGVYCGPRDSLPPLEVVQQALESGECAVLGELGLQYRGMALTDPALEPYLRLAESLDVPVGLHTGLGPPGAPYSGSPGFRIGLGNPKIIEEVLIRYPRLRLYLMHAGWPYLQDTIAVMYMYPQVYADLAVINWSLPRAAFHEYLKGLVDAGLGDRLMFGSDQMIWPDAIQLAVEAVESAPFLSDGQLDAIFYENAARFLQLGPEH